jgi:hypothetical protein
MPSDAPANARRLLTRPLSHILTGRSGRGVTRYGQLLLDGTLLAAFLATGSSLNCMAQASNPTLKVYAYQREVVSGIPGGPRGSAPAPRQMRYFIYLETLPRTEFAAEGVWMNGQYYLVDASVKATPIRFESPVVSALDDHNVAVPETTNTVTELIVKSPLQDKSPNPDTTRLLQDNAAVVQLKYVGRDTLVPIKKFEQRGPLYLR